MAYPEHHHPGQEEPRSHGEPHRENLTVDLNTAKVEELAELVGPDRARKLADARPFASWADVARVKGIGFGMIDNLKSGGAQLGPAH
jgi:DNA uptake protein ComE-like DNA-binding protein